MAVTDDELMSLAEAIKSNIAKEFSEHHMSGNLAKSVEISRDGNGRVIISIPATSYNMLQYQLRGVTIPNGHGSYASKLDTTGSEFFVYSKEGKRIKRLKPHNHTGYVDRVIDGGIEEWLTKVNGKYKIKGER